MSILLFRILKISLVLLGISSAIAFAVEVIDTRKLSDHFQQPQLGSFRTSSKVNDFYARLGLNKQYRFTSKQVKKDKQGGIHTRYQQTFEGIPIWGSQFIIHERSSKLRSTGKIVKGLEYSSANRQLKANNNQITSASAIEIVKGLSQHDSNYWEIRNEHSELIIYINGNNTNLAYIVNYVAEAKNNTSKPQPSRPFAIIDAATGNIIKQWDGLAHLSYGFWPWWQHKNRAL